MCELERHRIGQPDAASATMPNSGGSLGVGSQLARLQCGRRTTGKRPFVVPDSRHALMTSSPGAVTIYPTQHPPSGVGAVMNEAHCGLAIGRLSGTIALTIAHANPMTSEPTTDCRAILRAPDRAAEREASVSIFDDTKEFRNFVTERSKPRSVGPRADGARPGGDPGLYTASVPPTIRRTLIWVALLAALPFVARAALVVLAMNGVWVGGGGPKGTAGSILNWSGVAHFVLGFLPAMIILFVQARRLSARCKAHPGGLCPRCEHPLPFPHDDPVTCPECGLSQSRADHLKPWIQCLGASPFGTAPPKH
jgi:hypothetical protein